MNKVSIIGAGNVGATAAMCIARKDFVNNIVLLDIKEGVAEGKAMDIAQTAYSEGFNTRVKGVTNDYSATINSDVIVITSGVPRKPGMTREQLVGINSSIMNDVVTNCHKYSPKAIYVVVSNPMDTMSFMVYQILSKLGRMDASAKVFGMGGLLDSSRFAYFIQEALDKNGKSYDINDITAWVIGGHGDTTMIPMVDTATVDGQPLKNLLSDDEINDIVAKTMKGGATLTGLLGTSAWEGPGACIAFTVEALNSPYVTTMPCSVYRHDLGCYLGTLAEISEYGVSSIILAPYGKDLYDKIDASAEAVKKVNAELPKI